MAKILNYGSLNLDYVYDVEHFVSAGETLSSQRLVTNCGGKGLNQSIAAARAGATVYHAGKTGKDGVILRTLLKENNIDISNISECDSPSGHAIIQVNTSGQNCILLFAGSNHLITEAEIDSCLSHFDKGDYLILQNEINLIPYLMESAYKKGMYIVFNPSPITESIYDFPISKVSLLVLNEVEGKALSGETEPEATAKILYSKYGCNVLLSIGKDGAIYYDGSRILRHGIYKTAVADTTAAGDTLTGYFIACLAADKSPEEALKTASMASSLTVSRKGAAKSIPTLSEVENSKLEYMG